MSTGRIKRAASLVGTAGSLPALIQIRFYLPVEPTLADRALAGPAVAAKPVGFKSGRIQSIKHVLVRQAACPAQARRIFDDRHIRPRQRLRGTRDDFGLVTLHVDLHDQHRPVRHAETFERRIQSDHRDKA